MSTSTYRIGIIGAGNIGAFHAKAASEIPGVEVAAICDNGSGRAKGLAANHDCPYFSDYHNLLQEDLDLVTIATPSGLHLEPSLAAAERGIHVLCEKPIEITPERVQQMIEAHEKSGTYLGGIFNYRFEPVVEEIKTALRNQRLGKITYASASVPWWRDPAYYQDNWRGTWKLDGGGALMNQSIHMVDLLLYLLGPVHSLKSYFDTLNHQIETEDTASATLRFSNGALGHIFGTTAAYPGQSRRLEILGSEGSIVLVENTIATWDFLHEDPRDQEIRQKFGKAGEKGGASDPTAIGHLNHQKNLAAFIRAIEQKKAFEIDGKEAGRAVKVIHSIYQSSRENREIILAN